MAAVTHRVWSALCVGALLGVSAGLFLLRTRPVTRVSSVHSHIATSFATSTTLLHGTMIPLPTEGVIRLLFVGDIMMDRHVAERIRTTRDPFYPFRRLPIGWFDAFDFTVANLECPLTDTRRAPIKSIDFACDPMVATTLHTIGVDAVSQANNHSLDQGMDGYDDSIHHVRRAGLLVFGHGVRDDAIALATTTIRGKRFAFLGFNTTDHSLDEVSAMHTINQARAQADVVVVFMHWGVEYQDHPTHDQIARAHWLIDRGADAVIGGHPHWVQGLSVYHDKPIAYSLGNFVFDQYFSRETQEGLAVALVIDHDRITLEPIPISLDDSQPRVVEGTERETRLRHLTALSL